MATLTEKSSRAPIIRKPEKPIYAQASVLCNGQITWEAGRDLDTDYNKPNSRREDSRPLVEVANDLYALNSLQLYRSKPLTQLEIKQPLRHVQDSLPKDVQTRIYTGDFCGSAYGVFSCADEEFQDKVRTVFKDKFFRRLRRSEWLLWDVEAEKGHWVAVIAHLYNKEARNKGSSPSDPNAPEFIRAGGFNRIDAWCVVTATSSLKGDAIDRRVKKRLPEVFKQGGFKLGKDTEVSPIWIPRDETNWSSGIRIYALIKTLMHRITENHFHDVVDESSFGKPLPIWLNVDEIRAEMQGRAAQRCLAATGYESRIAIERVPHWIGVKEGVRANALRPQHEELQSISPSTPVSISSSLVVERGQGDESFPYGVGFSKGAAPINKRIQNGSSEITARMKAIPMTWKKPKKGRYGGPVGPPPAHVSSWEEDYMDYSSSWKYLGLTQPAYPAKSRQTLLDAEKQRNDKRWGGPVGPPPSHVYGWNDESSDDSNPFNHNSSADEGEISGLKGVSNQQTRLRHPSKRSQEAGKGIRLTQDNTKLKASRVPRIPENDNTQEHGNLKRKSADERSIIEADITEAGGVEEAIAKRLKTIQKTL